MIEEGSEPALHTLSRSGAKAFYDSFGARQDSQGFYEDAALDDLIAASDLPHAGSVFEFGCGTGKLAARLLEHHLRNDASYEAVDISSTMVHLAQTRLAPFGPRARVRQIDGDDPWRGARLPVDRVISTYVLDLLPDREIDAFLRQSAAALNPGGKLCIASLTFGNTLLTRFVMACWRALFRLSSRTVGGCRPVRIAERLSPDGWSILHRSVISAAGIASEVVVAARREREEPRAA